MLIDSHAHLDSAATTTTAKRCCSARRKLVWARCSRSASAKVRREMHQALRHLPPVQRTDRDAAPLRQRGIYPHNAPEADEAALAKLDDLLAEPEVIACGEIGLDYYHEGARSRRAARGA